MQTLLLVGAGGHASVVYDACTQIGIKNILVFDRDEKRVGTSLLNSDAILADSALQEQSKDSVFHLAIGDNHRREKLFEQLSAMAFEGKTICHPSSVVSSYANLQGSVFVAAQAVIAANAYIDKGVIINHGAIIDHDCSVGAFSHIAPNVSLSGAVSVGARCLVGAAATVLPGVTIGDEVTVAAGSVVTKNIPAHTKVKGIPASEFL